MTPIVNILYESSLVYYLFDRPPGFCLANEVAKGYRLSGDLMAEHHAWVNKLLPCYTGLGIGFYNSVILEILLDWFWFFVQGLDRMIGYNYKKVAYARCAD